MSVKLVGALLVSSVAHMAAAAEGVDLRFVPSSAIAAAVVHPSRTLASPSLEGMPIEVLSAAGLQELGFDPVRIGQAVIVFVPSALGSEPNVAAVLHFDEPFDRQAVVAKMARGTTAMSVDGAEYYPPARRGMPSVHVADDRTLIVGVEPLVRSMISAAAAQPDQGPMHELLSKVDTSADIVVLASVDAMRPMIVTAMQEAPQFPPPLEELKSIPHYVSSIESRVSIAGGLKAQQIYHAPNEASAKEVERLIKNGLNLGKQALLGYVLSQMPADGDAIAQASRQYMMRVIDRAFAALNPHVVGHDVVVDTDVLFSVANTGLMTALLLPAVQAAREAARRAQAQNHLKQIMLALHNYHDTHGRFPPRTSVDGDGKPLLSWRVALLPFLEEKALYDEFHQDEPWDSEHNENLIARMPTVFQSPNQTADPAEGKTLYLAPYGEDSIWDSKDGTRILEVTDGSSNTIMVVEGNDDAAVVWTGPDDLDYDPDDPLASLGELRPGGFSAALADGSVRFISIAIDADVLNALMTARGGEAVGDIP